MENIRLTEKDMRLFMHIPRKMSAAQIRGFLRRFKKKLKPLNLMDEKLLDVVFSTGECWMAVDVKKTADLYGEHDITYVGFFGCEDYDFEEDDEGYYKLEYEDVPISPEDEIIRNKILETLKEFCG